MSTGPKAGFGRRPGRSNRPRGQPSIARLAGCGMGNDSTDSGDAERAHWLERSREWLLADLKAWDGTRDDPHGLTRQMLTLWEADPDLAPVRQPDAIKKLAADEQKEWNALWNDVRRAMRK